MEKDDNTHLLGFSPSIHVPVPKTFKTTARAYRFISSIIASGPKHQFRHTHMSSSSSPYAHPRETTTLVGSDAQEYKDSPLKPAPLRIPSKTRPSTPKIVTQDIAGSSSRLSESQHDGHYSTTTPVHHAPVRTTASSLAGLVSKFEILDAMNNSLSGKGPVPPSHRTHGSIGTPSPEVSPPTESHVDLPQSLEDHNTAMREPSSGSISPLSTGSHPARE